MHTFKEWLLEYDKTEAHVVPSHETLDHPNEKNFYGMIGPHRVYHTGRHTYVLNDAGETIAHIGHKRVKGQPTGRLAISNATKKEGSSIKMGDVLHHLINKGHTLESDVSNTPSSHDMLMSFSKRSGIKIHIEDKHRTIVPHEGHISSEENQKKYSAHFDEPHFWDVNTHRLVFSKGD